MNSKSIETAYLFCPRCGTEAVAVGSVPFRCGQCGFANFFGPVAAVGGLVINDAGELLLVRRARDPGKGKWGLPGLDIWAKSTLLVLSRGVSVHC